MSCGWLITAPANAPANTRSKVSLTRLDLANSGDTLVIYDGEE